MITGLFQCDYSETYASRTRTFESKEVGDYSPGKSCGVWAELEENQGVLKAESCKERSGREKVDLLVTLVAPKTSEFWRELRRRGV